MKKKKKRVDDGTFCYKATTKRATIRI